MPLYEYQCRDCGKVVEVIQKFSDEPLSQCSECSGPLERLLSAPAIQFKGAGWYITDYARKSGNGDGGKAPAEGSAKDAKSSTQSKDSSDSGAASRSGAASE